jgi:hypothetical protein
MTDEFGVARQYDVNKQPPHPGLYFRDSFDQSNIFGINFVPTTKTA